MNQLFRILAVMFLTAPAYAALEKNIQIRPLALGMESAAYEVVNIFPPAPTVTQVRYREGDLITHTIDVKVVSTITQSSDGKDTAISDAQGNVLSRVVFSEPLFSLPDNAMIGGKNYQRAEEDGRVVIKARDIIVRVVRDGNLATYTYVQRDDAKMTKDINVFKYRGSSRLPESSEHIKMQFGAIVYRVIVHRILAPQ